MVGEENNTELWRNLERYNQNFEDSDKTIEDFNTKLKLELTTEQIDAYKKFSAQIINNFRTADQRSKALTAFFEREGLSKVQMNALAVFDNPKLRAGIKKQKEVKEKIKTRKTRESKELKADKEENLSWAERKVMEMNDLEMNRFEKTQALRNRIDAIRNYWQTSPPQSLESFNKDLTGTAKLSPEQIQHYTEEKSKFFSYFRAKKDENLNEEQKKAIAKYEKEQPSFATKWGSKTMGALMQIPVQAGNMFIKAGGIAFDAKKLVLINIGRIQSSKYLTKEYHDEVVSDIKRMTKEEAVAMGVTAAVVSSPGTAGPAPIVAATNAITAVGDLVVTGGTVATNTFGAVALGAATVKKGVFIGAEEYKFSLDSFQKNDPELYKKYQKLQELKTDPEHQDIKHQRQIAATEKWLIDEYANKQNKIIMMPVGGSKTRSDIKAVQETSLAKASDRVERLENSLKNNTERLAAQNTFAGKRAAVREKRDFKTSSFNR